MLISAWLTAVRNRLQSPSITKRRINRKQAVSASEGLEIRALLAATLQAVRPNVGEFLVQNEIRTVAPQELTLQFSLGSTITPSSISSNSIQVFRSGFDGIFGNGNDVPVTIGYVGPGSSPNEVVLRFGENLIDEHYRIVTNETGPNALLETVTTTSGTVNTPVTASTFNFELDLGAQVLAVDPQPVTVNANGTVTQARNQVVVYFNSDTLNTASANNAAFYQLIFTNETVTNLDDITYNPTTVVYNPATNTSTLTFASDLAALAGSGPGTFRLRIGNANLTPEAPVSQFNFADVGDSYATATTLGTISNTGNLSHIINSAVDPLPYAFTFPGSNTDPGHREIEVESHINGSADGTPGTSQINYNFKVVYGTDPLGNILNNVITAAQKQRAREVFEFYGSLLGIDFRETDALGLTIVTGDMRALDPTIPTGPGGVTGLAGGSVAIMDQAEVWNDGPGANWFSVAMHEIGHLLGQGHTYDLPEQTIQGSNPLATVGNVEQVFPGNADVIHGQYRYRPDSVDVDLYQFIVGAGKTGVFTTEVIAERLANASRLDSVIRLFRQNPDGSREMLAQNDDYFSSDSFLQVALGAGTYFVGISSTGNEVYDPTISGTGLGGTSQGSYQLRMDFRLAETTTLVDTTGTRFDGDADGKAGGVYNFWFKTATAANTLFVNKEAISTLSFACCIRRNDSGCRAERVAICSQQRDSH
ncbi:MAG: DVUA0089 family protein [Planctomycetaceae bacterium]